MTRAEMWVSTIYPLLERKKRAAPLAKLRKVVLIHGIAVYLYVSAAKMQVACLREVRYTERASGTRYVTKSIYPPISQQPMALCNSPQRVTSPSVATGAAMARREFVTSARYGRGGAGNIDTASQDIARAAANLEANGFTGDSFSQTSSPLDLVQRQEPSYVGRGGSGNYGSTGDPMHWEDSSSRSIEPVTRSRRDSQAQSPTYGRGGAGNYAASSSASQQNLYRRMTEEDLKREKLKADIEQGVNEQLAMPQKAKLPAGNP